MGQRIRLQSFGNQYTAQSNVPSLPKFTCCTVPLQADTFVVVSDDSVVVVSADFVVDLETNAQSILLHTPLLTEPAQINYNKDVKMLSIDFKSFSSMNPINIFAVGKKSSDYSMFCWIFGAIKTRLNPKFFIAL